MSVTPFPVCPVCHGQAYVWPETHARSIAEYQACKGLSDSDLKNQIDYKSRAESAEAELKHFQQSADTLERILNGGYVSHKSNCNWHKTLNDDHCNCGLDALLKNSKG